MKDFTGKNIFITGASSGLGAEFARQFHALRANVVLVARRLDKLNELNASLNAVRPGSSAVLQADLTSPEDLKRVCDLIKNSRIDVLINNAGFGSLGYFDEIDIEHETKMVDLNIQCTLQTLHAVIPQMKERKSGGIISLSSVAAFLPMPFMSTYAATKAFNFHHSLAIRQELSDFNINVLTVCPGPTNTEFFGAAHLSGMAKSMNRDSAEDVVKASINALLKNKAYIVTGIKSKLGAFLGTFLPISLSSRIIKSVLKNTVKAR